MALITLPRQLTVDISGEPRVGAQLSVYNAGTNDTRVVYTTKAFSVELSQPVESVEGGIFPAIYVNPSGGDFKLVITDADGAPIYTEDNIPSQLGATDIDLTGLADVSVDSAILSSLKRTTAESSAGVIPVNYAFYPGDVRRYGADPTGVGSSDSAFAQALLQAAQTNGAEIIFPGTYLITTGIIVAADGIHMRGSGIGKSILKAGANSINVLKVAAQRCSIWGGFSIDGNGKTAVHGLVFAPSTETTGGPYYINNNTVIGLKVSGCDEGVRFRSGPTVFDQTYFNTLMAIEAVDCVRSLWFQLGGSPINRNYIFNFRAGSTSTVCNTGLQIDDGSGNEFHGLEVEGMLNGTSPNATPQGVIIIAGTQNNDNKFFGGFAEACTVGVTNANSLSEFFGFSVANCTTPAVYTALPPILIGGTGASVLAQIFGPFLHQTNSQIAGYDNNCIGLTPGVKGVQFNTPQVSSSNVNVLDDYQEGTWTPVLAGASVAGTQTYSAQQGKYTKIGRKVTASVTILLTAKGGTMSGAVTVTGLPYAAVAGGNSHSAVSGFGAITFAANYTQLGAYLAGATSTINIVRSGSGQAFANVDASEISNTSYLEFTMEYQAAT